jgi:hypothetical protein
MEEIEYVLDETYENKLDYLHSDICLTLGKDDLYNFQFECLTIQPDYIINMLICMVKVKTNVKGFYFNLNRDIIFV